MSSHFIKNHKLVLEISKHIQIDDTIKEAFIRVDREAFVNDGFRHLAYKLDALPMAANQWISSPLTVAKMTHYLEPNGADSVLEIGLGSGYQAAVLSKLIRRVFSIERIEKLLLDARERIKQAKISNINTRLDDGQKGWSEFAPFDRILFSASTNAISPILFEQLNENGILVAPIEKGGKQVITKFVKKRGMISSNELESCLFVPVLDGVIAKSA